MIKYTDADTGREGYLMVSRIIRIIEAKPGSRAKSEIQVSNGEHMEYVGAWETAQILSERVIESQSWQTAIANDVR